ncbi:MAG: bifunctional hydroxymethylpyrimidine kinase/phosphomethylpyrimidine kinase [Nitrosopumilaceae archaeon]
MNVLSIGGSDPSSGAGIQSDIKTFSVHGVYGLTVVTAITGQNTRKFSKIEKISPNAIKDQMDSVLSDFKIDAIKIGMVYSSPTITAIYSKLKGEKIPIVLDPVFESSTGGQLLLKSAFSDYKRLLIPLAFVTTPNIFEARRLASMKIKHKKDMVNAAKKISQLGVKNVVITGGHLPGNKVTDHVREGEKSYDLTGKRLPIKNHGGGCTFSASLSANLAKGLDLKSAIKLAKEFTFAAIRKSLKVGKGLFVATSDGSDKIKNGLYDAISNFTNLKDVYKIIPECQTNFVFAKPNPTSLKDIIGVSGRIVKAGKSVITAGNLEYGGSTHVGSAVLEIVKKFPLTRSAVNIKYDRSIIRKSQTKKFAVLNYDRTKEPPRIRTRENSTISWGIRSAIKNAKKTPDLIFHKGDVGKEPMILLFGRNPNEVLLKLSKII